MTRLAVLSDIHGNLPALEAVMADMVAFRPDAVVVAGDVVNWGPFSCECVEIVQREGWAVIRGNNEYYLLDHDTPREPAAWLDRTQWPMLAWLKEQLNDYHARIAMWPDELSLCFPDGPPIRVVHGVSNNPWKGLYAAHDSTISAPLLAGIAEPIVIAGHTHLAMNHTVDQWQVLNPGTVGVPLSGTGAAQYMLLDAAGDAWNPIFRSVDYDQTPVFKAFEAQHFVQRCGPIGHAVVKEFETSRMQLTPLLMWREAMCPGAPFDMALWQTFLEQDWFTWASPEYRF